MADDFDPRAFVAEHGDASDFDPKAFLAEHAPGAIHGGNTPIEPAGPMETGLNFAVDMIPAARPVTNFATGLTRKLLSPKPIRLGPTMLAAGNKQVEDKTPTLLNSYRDARDTTKQREAQGAKDNPGAALGGSGVGLLLSLMAPLPKVTAGAKAGMLGRLGANVATGVGYGGLNALANGKADLTKGEFKQAGEDLAGKDGFEAAADDFAAGHYGRAALDVAGAGIPGAALTAAGISSVAPTVGKLGGGLLRRIVKPTDEAKALMAQGVPLTLGQMNPEGSLNAIEHAGSHSIGAGPILEAQREAPVRAWQQLGMREAIAPGAPPPIPGHNLNEQLAQAYRGFSPAYDTVRELPVTPLSEVPAQGPSLRGGQRPTAAIPLHEAIQPTAETIADSLADDQTVNVVGRYLKNQSSRLANVADAGQPFTAGPLLKMRDNIRDAIQTASQAGKTEQVALLRNAADEITRSLEAQMPENASRLLGATDGAYSRNMIISDAIKRSGDRPHGFTPSNLEAAVKAAAPSDAAYARGWGGKLRELSRGGRAVFDAPVPSNGMAALVAGHAGIHFTAPLAAALNGLGASAAAGLPAAGPAMSPAVTAHTLALIHALRNKSDAQPPQAVASGDMEL